MFDGQDSNDKIEKKNIMKSGLALLGSEFVNETASIIYCTVTKVRFSVLKGRRASVCRAYNIHVACCCFCFFLQTIITINVVRRMRTLGFLSRPVDLKDNVNDE